MAEVWLTYRELAERLGVSPEAARQKAMRGRWRRQQGNDGKARVLVDFEMSKAGHRVRKRPDEQPSEQPDNTRTIAALDAHIATLKEAIAKAETLAEERQVDVQTERQRVAEMTTELLRMTSQMMAAATERDDALRRADDAVRELAALRERPWWKRLAG